MMCFVTHGLDPCAKTAAAALSVAKQHNWSWKMWNPLNTSVESEGTVKTMETVHKECWLEHGRNLIKIWRGNKEKLAWFSFVVVLWLCVVGLSVSVCLCVCVSVCCVACARCVGWRVHGVRVWRVACVCLVNVNRSLKWTKTRKSW